MNFLTQPQNFKKQQRKQTDQGPRAKDLEPLLNFLPCWEARVPLLWPTLDMAEMLPMLGLSVSICPTPQEIKNKQTKVRNR